MPSCRTAITALLLLLLLPLAAKKRPHVPDSLQTLTYEVNGVPIRMQRVEGGSFVMGATPDQHDPDTYTDKPAHLVFLSPYYMATTEVTNHLWRAVMSEKEILASARRSTASDSPREPPMTIVRLLFPMVCSFSRRPESSGLENLFPLIASTIT